MKPTYTKSFSLTFLMVIVFATGIVSQDVHIDVGKRSQTIPKSCERVEPAKIDGEVDVPALVKEAICKGAGDMLADYTYTVHSVKLARDKKGKVKDEETFVYEVFIPTLLSGMRTRGVQVVTSHNGVAVAPAELEKARAQAAEKIEKEEERITLNKPVGISPPAEIRTGMVPLGMYTRTTISHSALGMKTAGVTLAVADFLRASELKLARREQVGGRDTLVFDFSSRPGTEFIDNEKYMSQISGEIWIDAADRMVTRLIGWPSSVSSLKGMGGVPEKTRTSETAATLERPPAIFVEMMRLPQGVWLPHIVRINGADYPTLFNGIKTDSTSTNSNYIRFSTEVKDFEVDKPKNP